MKNAFKVFKRDLKNICTSWVTLVVVIALIVLPALYAWFNIKAMWDPYGNTSGIKIAVVNEDKGSTLEGKKIDIGDEIVKNLKENDKIGWQFVNEEEALEGVKNGKYYASMIIPESFSQDLISLTEDTITEPTIKYTVNEKLNSVAPKITDKGVQSVRDQMSEQVVKTVDGIIFTVLNKVGIEVNNSKPELRKLIDIVYNLNDKVPEIEDVVNKAYDGTISIDEMVSKVQGLMPTVEDTIKSTEDLLTQSKDYINKAQNGVQELAPIIKDDLQVSKTVTSGLNALLTSIDENSSPEEIKAVLVKVQERANSLNNVVTSLRDMLKKLNFIKPNQTLKELIETLNDIIQGNDKIISISGDLISKIDSRDLLEGINSLKETVNRVDNTIGSVLDKYDSEIVPTINSTINQIDDISSNALNIITEADNSLPQFNNILSLVGKGSKLGNEELGLLKEKLPELKEKLGSYVEKIKGLDDEEKIDKLLDLMINDSNASSSFLSSPIQIQENKLFAVPNYGSGMSPFFTTLSIWIGSLLLLSLFTTHAGNLEDGVEIKPIEEYLGKYFLFATMAILQSLVVTIGDIVILKTYVVHPIVFILLGVFISLVFITIVYTLVSLLKNVGKAISIILLVLQIAASGGTYPIEVMPKFFQIIHPLLPFKYAIGGMREAVGGIVQEALIKDILVLFLFFVIFLAIGLVCKGFFNKMLKSLSKQLEESGIVGH